MPENFSEGQEQVTLSGELTCLPKKGPGPHTMECAFGLKADDGTHWALRYLWEVAPGLTDTQMRIRVTGVVGEMDPNTSYDVAGVLEVISAQSI